MTCYCEILIPLNQIYHLLYIHLPYHVSKWSYIPGKSNRNRELVGPRILYFGRRTTSVFDDLEMRQVSYTLLFLFGKFKKRRRRKKIRHMCFFYPFWANSQSVFSPIGHYKPNWYYADPKQKMSTRDESCTIGTVQGCQHCELIVSWHVRPEEAGSRRGVLSLSVQPGALLEFQIWWLGCEVELLNGNLLWILRKRWRRVLHCVEKKGGSGRKKVLF